MSRKKLPYKTFSWNRNLAYAIGLIVTDGSMSRDGRHIVFSSSDLELIKIFKSCLNLNNKITEKKKSGWTKKTPYMIQFGNIQLYNWLLSIGLHPNKTYDIGKIKIPDEYFPDFLRGHLDGDGSIWTYIDRWNTFKNKKYVYKRLYIRFLSASQKHILWLQTSISRLLGISGRIYERKPSRPNQKTSLWELKFAKKDSMKLIGLIYYNKNVPCLKRKRKVADDFIN